MRSASVKVDVIPKVAGVDPEHDALIPS